MSAALLRGAAFYGLWVALIGTAPANLAFGVVVAAAAAWTSLRLLPPGPARVRLTALPGLALRFLWQSVVAHVDAGIALAVDYGHVRDARPESGSLTAYRSGDVVAAVPDGSCNLTAHVAVDALAHRVGASVVRQRQALHELGVDGVLPDHALSLRDPAAYLDALAAASQAAELLGPAGLGAFWWIRTDV